LAAEGKAVKSSNFEILLTPLARLAPRGGSEHGRIQVEEKEEEEEEEEERKSRKKRKVYEDEDEDEDEDEYGVQLGPRSDEEVNEMFTTPTREPKVSNAKPRRLSGSRTAASALSPHFSNKQQSTTIADLEEEIEELRTELQAAHAAQEQRFTADREVMAETILTLSGNLAVVHGALDALYRLLSFKIEEVDRRPLSRLDSVLQALEKKVRQKRDEDVTENQEEEVGRGSPSI
jgi:hypothetical protein